MMTARLFVVLMACVLFTSVPAQAQVALLFDNGPMDYANGWEMTWWTEADDFELAFSAPATRITMGMLDTTCTFPGNWDGVLRWWILNDEAGLPGSTVIATGISPQVSFYISQDDCPSGWAWYEQSFSLGQQVNLEGGVRYWLAIHMAGDWSVRRDLYWATTATGAFNAAAYQTQGVGAWSYTPLLQHAFMILAHGDDLGIFSDEFESGSYDIWSSFA